MLNTWALHQPPDQGVLPSTFSDNKYSHDEADTLLCVVFCPLRMLRAKEGSLLSFALKECGSCFFLFMARLV